MGDPNRRRGTITWAPDPTPAARPSRRPTCERCSAGDCHLCVRVGCFHDCGPGLRRFGLAAASSGAEHGAPGPGRA